MKLKNILFIFLVVLISGCASGPKYTTVHSSIPALEFGKGRIYFYRSANMFGAGIQPTVILNSEEVGDATPGGFFFVDREPGDYEVVLTTEVEKELTFQLDEGEEQYVRMTVGLGAIVYRVYPELVEEDRALEEMKGLSYTGSAMN